MRVHQNSSNIYIYITYFCLARHAIYLLLFLIITMLAIRSAGEVRGDEGREGQAVAKAVVSVLAGAFVVGVIVFSCLSFNYQNIQRLNFPVSSSAQVCNL
jgi:hypothetical protein